MTADRGDLTRKAEELELELNRRNGRLGEALVESTLGKGFDLPNGAPDSCRVSHARPKPRSLSTRDTRWTSVVVAPLSAMLKSAPSVPKHDPEIDAFCTDVAPCLRAIVNGQACIRSAAPQQATLPLRLGVPPISVASASEQRWPSTRQRR